MEKLNTRNHEAEEFDNKFTTLQGKYDQIEEQLIIKDELAAKFEDEANYFEQ